MSNEPEYLKRLRKTQSQPGGAEARRGGAEGAPSVQEKEALRWAREVAGTDLRSVKGLSGARYVVLLGVQSATGARHHSLEGLPSREALVQRMLPGAGMGEEILGSYEVKGGRPITTEVVEGDLKFKMGLPRPRANPVSPEKMLRQAAAEAAKLAKTRPRDRDQGRGR